MSLKETLQDLKSTVLEFGCHLEQNGENINASNNDTDLSCKVDSFIEWYKKNINEKWQKADEIRSFIETMAVWYELRFPDYEVDVLYRGEGDIGKRMDKVMFWNNEHLIDRFSEFPDSSSNVIYSLDWSSFFDYNIFLKGLPFRYGKFIAPKDSKCLEREGVDAEKWEYQQEEMFKCVMYRLIERGGRIIGPRRAFRFAKEFGKSIDIPMMYAVDYSDPHLITFIQTYIESGGSKDLQCYVGYFSRKNRNEKMDIISIQQILENYGINQEKIRIWENHGASKVKVLGECSDNKGV